MKNFEIEIVEILRRVINVEAEDLDSAIDEVQKMYDTEEIVLDASDFIQVSINDANFEE